MAAAFLSLPVGVILVLLFSGGQLCAVMLEYEVIQVSGCPLSVPIIVDAFSLSFSGSVGLVAGAVLIFSTSYMKLETHFFRFHLLVLSFVVSMLILIFSPNLISLLLGWDGLGVTSFLLVVFFNSHKSLNAGLITALSNRVGDCLILIAIAYAASCLPLNTFLYSEQSLNISCLAVSLLALASITKSAQIPFSAWLPAAMAAPTPVSSLVHSSTLVTAGVYLMIRFNFLLPPSVCTFLLTLGTLTLTMASLSALFETDLKKIVALSTLSQLGLMMVSTGANLATAAMFHLLTHAYFKAMLFMGVGNTIHLAAGDQDLRLANPGSLSVMVTPAFNIVANMSLMGMPFMAGFYSKDMIIEKVCSTGGGVLVLSLLLLSVSLTAMYSTRFLAMLVWAPAFPLTTSSHGDNDTLVSSSISILWPFAIGGGAMLSWVLMPSPEIIVAQMGLKFLIVAAIIGGAISGQLLVKVKTKPLWWMSWGVGSLWSLPLITGRIIIPALNLAAFVKSYNDSKWAPYYTLVTTHLLPSISLAHRYAVSSTSFMVISALAGVSLLIY